MILRPLALDASSSFVRSSSDRSSLPCTSLSSCTAALGGKGATLEGRAAPLTLDLKHIGNLRMIILRFLKRDKNLEKKGKWVIFCIE